jgi:hypothetical protein
MMFRNILWAVMLPMALTVNAQTHTDTTATTASGPFPNFRYDKPDFKLAGEQLANPGKQTRFTILTGYREGVKQVSAGFLNFSLHEDIPGTARFYMYNLSIVEMLKHNPFVEPSHVLLEVKDPSKYKYDLKYGSKEAWMKKNAYCYEVFLPGKPALTMVPLIDSMLAQEFRIKFGMQHRLVKALVLVRTSTQDKIKSAGGEAHYGSFGFKNDGLLRNVPLSTLASQVDNAGMLPPMVDETGYAGSVDIDFKMDSWTDLDAMRKVLQSHDLDLKEEMRSLDMFVITEVNIDNP